MSRVGGYLYAGYQRLSTVFMYTEGTTYREKQENLKLILQFKTLDSMFPMSICAIMRERKATLNYLLNKQNKKKSRQHV